MITATVDHDNINGGRRVTVRMTDDEASALVDLLNRLGGFGPMRLALGDDLRLALARVVQPDSDRMSHACRGRSWVGEVYVFDGPLSEKQAQIKREIGVQALTARIREIDDAADAVQTADARRATTPIPRHVRAIDLREDE